MFESWNEYLDLVYTLWILLQILNFLLQETQIVVGHDRHLQTANNMISKYSLQGEVHSWISRIL